MAEDARLDVVVITPDLRLAVPFQLFSEGSTARIFGGIVRFTVADANQTVGDVAGRLDFDVFVRTGSPPLLSPAPQTRSSLPSPF